MKVTFVLPEDNTSGGVRVTTIMGNLLLNLGYDVRIIYPSKKILSKDFWIKIKNKISGHKETGRLKDFKGIILKYSSINNISFSSSEVVIAVGTYMIKDVYSINHDVIKIRYNHGFPAEMTDFFTRMWSLKIPTITVSNTLAPKIKELSGDDVKAVIPNGIETDKYYNENINRDGVGIIYSTHPNKAPSDIIKVMNAIKMKWPDIPQYVFSTEAQPDSLKHCNYYQFPSVDLARKLYNQSKIWLLTSYTEGLPGSVLEAMACGCIVISTDNDGSCEIIRDGYNGILVPKGDINAFIEKIIILLSDNALQKKLIQGATQTVAAFSWDNAAKKMDIFLKNLK